MGSSRNCDDVQPDLVIESYLDARYYRFQPDEFDMIIPIFAPTRAALDSEAVVTMAGLGKTAVRSLLKQAHLEAACWSYACRMSARMMREKVLGRIWKYPLFGQLVGMWKGHDKASTKSLEDRGAIGKLLDIDIWESQTTRILVSNAVVKGSQSTTTRPIPLPTQPWSGIGSRP